MTGGVSEESGEWRVESGEWRVESGEWRVESGEWRVERPCGMGTASIRK
ncbi:phosphotransferase [Akkermansia muciniphila]|nr:phosphotransferase [Akkermansia muciniphila]